jgi:hypothetical protein
MAAYDDPYSNNRYPNSRSDYNAPSYSNQEYYDSTGPTYDPYRQPAGQNVRFDDDATKDERPPTPPSKYEDDDGAPARQRSTRTVGSRSGSMKKKNESLSVAVAPVRKHWNGFEHGEFTPVTGTRRGSVTNLIPFLSTSFLDSISVWG